MNDASPQEIQGSLEKPYQGSAPTSGSGSSDEGAAPEWLTDPNAWSISHNTPDDADKGYVWFYIPWLDPKVQQGNSKIRMERNLRKYNGMVTGGRPQDRSEASHYDGGGDQTEGYWNTPGNIN